MQTEPEPTVEHLSAIVKELVLGMKWFLGMFLVVVSIPNLFTTLSIRHFQEVFMDALPDKPLPSITMMFIGYYWFFLFMTFVWPIAGLILISRGKRVRNWAIGLQFMLTEYAMFIPMVEIGTGMSDSGSK